MSNPNTLPAIARQLEDVQHHLESLTDRMERVETHLGLDVRAASATVAPPVVDRRPTTNDREPAPGSRLPAPSPRFPATSEAPAPALTPCSEPMPSPGAGSRELGARAQRPSTTGEWERLIGGKWALWVGSVAVFLAIAFFLAYTWQYLSPAGRLGIGFLAGFAFLGASGLARDRVESWFGEGLAGGGLAILYLTIWTGSQRYELLPFSLAFALMVLVTASGVALSLRTDAVSLAALATLGGFLTPVVIRASGGGEGQPLSFLTYVALLNAGILTVSLSRRWRGLTWLSFAATLLLVTGWAEPDLIQRHRGTLFAFATLYFLIYLGAACFYSLIRREKTDPQDLLLLTASAFLYALDGHGLLSGVMGTVPGAFALSLSLAFALLTWAVRTLAPENATLRDFGIGLALFFLTIAVPIQLRQGWVAIGWSLQATVLLTVGERQRAQILTRAGQVVWALSLLSLAGVLLTTEPTRRILLFNERALPLLISVLGAVWLTVRTAGTRQDAEDRPVDELADVYAGYTVLGGAWLIAQETYLGFGWRQIPSATTWQAGALCAIAALWALGALATFAAGMRLRHPILRCSALALLFLAAALPAALASAYTTTGWTPFWNLRWLACVTAGAATGGILRLMAREPDVEWADRRFRGWAGLVGIILVLLWGITQETYETFRYFRELLGTHWDRAAQMGISLVWSVSGALLLVAGIVRRSQPIRLLALSLLGVTVLKVFLFDLGFLDTAYRILSFAGLGLALIGISWLYSRYGTEEARS